MNELLHRQFLDYSADTLRKYTSRIETCLADLTEDQVCLRGSNAENAIGNLVLHLSGNVRQWIVAGVGGQPDRRDRDAEFAARGSVTIPGLVARLSATIGEAASAISQVTPARMTDPLLIQGYDVNVMEAIYHVVEHFSHHTGQIIFATKLIRQKDLGFYAHLSGNAVRTEPKP
jgi:uncharacterized damage-inducible protein DinB